MPTMTQAGYTPPQKSMPPKAKSPKKPKKNKKRKKGIGTAGVVSLVIFLIAVLIGSCTLFLYAQTAPYADKFLPNTSISGYALGGLTAQEGAAALAMLTDDAVSAWQYTLTWGERTYTLDGAAVSLAVDTAATLDPLWQIGRGGNMLTRYLAMLSLRGDGQAEKPVLTYDMDAVDAFLADMKADIDCDSVDATVAYVAGNSEPFRFTDEQAGRELETDAIRARIEASILNLSPETEALKPKEISPKVYRVELENATVLRARVIVPLSGSAAAQENAALAAVQFQGARIEPARAFRSIRPLVCGRRNPATRRRRNPLTARILSAWAAASARFPPRCIGWRCWADWKLPSGAQRFIRSITVKSVRKPPFPIRVWTWF